MLSIIIPTLNDEKYLPLLLQTIEKRNLNGECEIVVSDAGSRDRTIQVASDFGCKVVSGGLPAKGRNQGAKAATGDLFLFLDAEALLPKDFLAKILVEFERRSLDIASCRLEPIEEEWMPRFILPRFFYNLLYNWPIQLLESAFPYASSLILVKRELHERLLGFDQKIRIGEDHDYARRAAKVGKFGVLKSSKLPLFMRRCREEGIIRTNVKYQLCNLFNVSLGEVTSDIFRYDFEQCKSNASEYKEPPKKLRSLVQFPWTMAYYIMAGWAIISWLIFFLILAPRMVGLRIVRLLSWLHRSELLTR
ncbi:MAG: glycosyltransferase [Dehalococcoidia bacterium]